MQTKEMILQKYFGYSEFRSGQSELIEQILNGRPVVAVMPTGAGKSLCYQLPALMLEGLTLVVSPLISLMKDQVRSLAEHGVEAAYLSSGMSKQEYGAAVYAARNNKCKLLYVSPERLQNEQFKAFASELQIALVVVDEAHCVVRWGESFRPAYLAIKPFLDGLPKAPVVAAFTATATPVVRREISKCLGLEQPLELVTGFDRSNLTFIVEKPMVKRRFLRSWLPEQNGCGIIYCATQKQTEEVCNDLNAWGYPAGRYHAGLTMEERQRNQKAFIKNELQVMVATNAFGMGIDKPDVRFVLHYTLPLDVEGYYQEAGRAGRDGDPAECILLYSGKDVVTNQYLIERGQDNQEMEAAVWRLVRERDQERLKQMTFYCFTHDCLREYILKYFGEYGKSYCGNCLNCQTEFEEQDVSQEARAMIRCVESSGQRYGVNVILDTLRGASTAKIRQYEMDGNPEYGVCAKIPAHRLRQIFNYLVLKEYLHLTDDGYTIVKLTAASRSLLEEAHILTMKMSKELETKKKEKRSRLPKSAVGELGEQDEPLFQKLRALRLEIAREEKIPPYMVFSDKTLIHMCILKPGNEEEMLNVTGVGRHKYEKYGKRFIDAVKNL